MKNIKRSKFIIFILTYVLCLSACKVQQPSYVGLYVGNRPIEEKSLTLDTTDVVAVDSVQVVEEQISSVENSNTYKNEADSIRAVVPSSNNIVINAEYVNIFKNGAQYDSITVIKKQKPITHDTVYIEKEVVKTVPVSSQTNIETSALITAQNDSIQQLKKQVNELKNQKPAPTDTVYIEKEVIKAASVSSQTSKEFSAIITAQKDSIQQIKKQVNELKNQKPTTPDTVYIQKEVVKTVPVSSQTNKETSALITAQMDSIQQLKKQVNELKNQKPAPADTVYVEKEVIKAAPVSSQTSKEFSSIITAQNDSIQQLKRQVNELKIQKLASTDTVYIKKEVIEKVTTEMINADTLTFTAYYEIGTIVPISADSILYEIKNTLKSNNLITIIISGYTDISGSSDFNKALTQKRIDYFINELKDYVSQKQLLTQNFGDTYASKTLKESERKLVFTIILQKK